MTFSTAIIIAVAQLLLIPLFSPLVIGIIRKCKAKLQGRVGASVIQPYRDLRKLFSKDEVISSDASWVFYVTPYLLFAISLLLASAVPVLVALTFNPMSDLLIMAYLLGLSAFLSALAGMDTGSAFGGFGSSREMTFTALVEGALLFSLLPFIFIFGTTDVSEIVARMHILPLIAFFPLSLAGIAYMIALLTENARIPVDNPTTHLELTMIHEAMILEYSGKRLALIEWASWNKLLLFIVLGLNLFVPWGFVVALTAQAVVKGFIILSVKIALCIGIIALIESTMAKFRIFRVPEFIFTSLVLGIISVLIIIL